MTNNIGWPLQTGQDFLPNHAVNGIDYGSIHFWPDNWARVDTTFGMNWLLGHANLSQAVLRKPLVVEEFGKAYGGKATRLHPLPSSSQALFEKTVEALRPFISANMILHEARNLIAISWQ